MLAAKEVDFISILPLLRVLAPSFRTGPRILDRNQQEPQKPKNATLERVSY